jgi:hypothetical protein
MTEVQLQQRDVAEVRGNSFMQEISLGGIYVTYQFGR